MIIDSHMHINNELDNKDEIIHINSCPYIDSVINVGMDTTTSKEVIEIAKKNKKFYAAVGIHPLRAENSRVNSIFELATSSKVVAIGETGLDCSENGYNNNNNNNLDYEKQKEVFVRQIQIANELKLPVIIHSNNTNGIIFEIFNSIRPKYGCVFHCFQPKLDDLKKILSYKNDNKERDEYYISFAGKIMLPNASASLEVAKIVPEDRFLIETDSPYLKPISRTVYINQIVNRLAEIRRTTPEEIVRITNENTKRLFKKIK